LCGVGWFVQDFRETTPFPSSRFMLDISSFEDGKGTLSAKFYDKPTNSTQLSQLHHGVKTKPRTVRTVSDKSSTALLATAAITLLLLGNRSFISLAKMSSQIIYICEESLQLISL
jgi:hypothetical protein